MGTSTEVPIQTHPAIRNTILAVIMHAGMRASEADVFADDGESIQNQVVETVCTRTQLHALHVSLELSLSESDDTHHLILTCVV